MDLRTAHKESKAVLSELGLDGWTLGFDKAKRRAGSCNHARRLITLSEHFVQLNAWEIVKATLLHEAAHALIPAHHGHDWTWKMKCRELGISSERCYDSDEVAMPKGNIVYECATHGEQARGHRMPKRTFVCRKCRQRLRVYRAA